MLKKYSYYIKLLAKHQSRLVVAISMMIINSVVLMILPFVTSDIMNGLATINKVEISSFKRIIIIFILFNVLMHILNYTTELTFSKVGIDIDVRIKTDIKDSLFYIKEADSLNSGNIMQTFMSDSSSLGVNGLLLLYQSIYTIISTIAFFFFLVTISKKMALVVLVVFLISGIGQVFINKLVTKCMDQIREQGSKYYYVLSNYIRYIKDYRRLNAISYFSKQLYKTITPYNALTFRRTKLTTTNSLVLGIVSLFITAYVFYVGAFDLKNEIILIGDLFAFNIYAQRLGGQILRVPSLVIGVKGFDLSYSKVLSLVSAEIHTLESNNDINVAFNELNSITFENVDFFYNTDAVLKKLNVNFNTGKIYCIKGNNGTGKTTLLNLIAAESKIFDGKTFINGKEYTLFSNKITVNQHISYQPTSSLMFKDTVRNNLSLCESDYSDQQLDYYFQMLNLKCWIDEKTDRYQYLLNDETDNLSSGQKQKLALIRTLLNRRKIMMFDEPEKCLDQISMQKFMEHLLEIKDNRIIIVVSHNQFIQNQCNKIFCMDTMSTI